MTHTPTVHNPTHFEPRDYVVENYLDNRRPDYYGQPIAEYEREVALWQEEMQQTFGHDWRAKIHRCVHCGNGTVRWITAVRHLPTNDVVVFGAVCTDRLGFANKVAFKLAQLQARAEARKVRFTIWTKRQEFIAAHPEVAEALAHINDEAHAKNTFVKDVLAKLDQYGSLSDKQVEAIATSMQRDLNRAAERMADAAEPKGDAPSGRQEVTGTVVSVQERESDFGVTLKMLVKLTNNAKVWVTVPSGSGIERGDTVTVRATWTVSKDDKSFAFGSRPHLVARTPAVAEVTPPPAVPPIEADDLVEARTERVTAHIRNCPACQQLRSCEMLAAAVTGAKTMLEAKEQSS